MDSAGLFFFLAQLRFKRSFQPTATFERRRLPEEHPVSADLTQLCVVCSDFLPIAAGWVS